MTGKQKRQTAQLDAPFCCTVSTRFYLILQRDDAFPSAASSLHRTLLIAAVYLAKPISLLQLLSKRNSETGKETEQLPTFAYSAESSLLLVLF